MATFSFVHAADIHLDSPFAGVAASAPHIRDAMIQASFDAWRNLVDFCIEEQAAFLLLAGDVFDWEDRSIRAQLAFRDGCMRLAGHGIGVYAVHGNHDPLQGRYAAIELPANVKIFGSVRVESCIAELQGAPIAAISGISYQAKEEKRNLARMFASHAIPEGLFSIGLVHANLGSSTGHAPYAPCSMKDLSLDSVDYWALGHVHQKRIAGEEPYIVYPGNIQGRSFTEQGERGAYLVRVRGGAVASLDFRPLDAVRFLAINASITAHRTLDSLLQDMIDALYQATEDNPTLPLICRFILSGRGVLFHELIGPEAVEQLLENMRETFLDRDPFVWVEKIRCQCQPEKELSELMGSDDLLARVLKDMADMESSPEDLLEFGRKSLKPLFGRRLVSGAMGKLSESDVLEMLAEARNLCIDFLRKEDA